MPAIAPSRAKGSAHLVFLRRAPLRGERDHERGVALEYVDAAPSVGATQRPLIFVGEIDLQHRRAAVP
jgi:hypothetical protein